MKKVPVLAGSWPIVGHLFQFRKNPLAFIIDAKQKHGDIIRLNLAGKPVYILSDPALIHEVLVVQAKSFHKSRALKLAKMLLGEGLLTSEGEHHLRQRRMMAPAFHRKKIMDYGLVMSGEAHKFSGNLQAGANINLHDAMMQLTLAIVARTLFDADVAGDAREVGSALHDALSLFERVSNPFAPLLAKLPLPATRKLNRARERLFRVIDRIIREHEGVDRGDLLSMLLAAVDEEDNSKMSLEQVRDEALTLFLAGHETTANALTWAFYLLAKHPQVRTKLQEEADRVAKDGAPISPEQIASLPYARDVFQESLRLYPPAWLIGRSAMADVTLGEWDIAQGSIILMSQFAVHRDERWFADPLQFRPERWQEASDRPKFAYFPFGGGPRTCIGDQFAWMEGTLLLAEISRHWEFEPLEETLDPEPLITLRPRGGLPVKCVARSSGE
jgi:cytochrome P450